MLVSLAESIASGHSKAGSYLLEAAKYPIIPLLIFASFFIKRFINTEVPIERFARLQSLAV